MKPKIFIGSSVEGLGVAYSIQQNLTQDAESTVWDQGIFELSLTAIESLTKAVENSDIGVFVFSPDDITKMRGAESNTIRDNVIFEFGLFVGRLGRDRVFFITPEGTDFRLPTDLLGVTPGKYNPMRDDGSLQAATGPACNQIRQAIKKLPPLTSQHRENESDEAEPDSKTKMNPWIQDFLNNDYSSARKKLEEQMKEKSEEDKLEEDRVWMAYIDFKENEITGLDSLIDIAKSNKQSPKIITLVSRMLSWEHYSDIVLEILQEALLKFPANPELVVLLSECLKTEGDKEGAINVLSKDELQKLPAIAIALADIYEEEYEIEQAIECIHTSYIKFPSNTDVLYKYARLLQESNRHKEALYLLNCLAAENPKEVAYWGYMSNTCLQLNLYDKAMTYCKKALELSQGEEAWILLNIGNMFNNKGFYSEAEEWLNKGLLVDPESEYAHDRLATAIKNRNEEQKNFTEFCKEGRISIRNKKQ